MISKYTRTLKNGRQIDVFMNYEEHPENFIVYMRNAPELSAFPQRVIEGNDTTGSVFTEFLEESEKLKEFEKGTTFAMKLRKGEGFRL